MFCTIGLLECEKSEKEKIWLCGERGIKERNDDKYMKKKERKKWKDKKKWL